jgi:hypothetical protein
MLAVVGTAEVRLGLGIKVLGGAVLDMSTGVWQSHDLLSL